MPFITSSQSPPFPLESAPPEFCAPTLTQATRTPVSQHCLIDCLPCSAVSHFLANYPATPDWHPKATLSK